ncbi:MAG TPA: extracellular solute-binding protein [Stellaceae bacterium]|nr:extracellular solute-binding protein [Stellaceae bacterium]
MSGTSRRDILKIAVAGAAGAALSPVAGRAADKSLTLLRETSFIATFDEYMQKTLAPAYENETGVKIVYELTSVGSLPTRISTIIETGSGADVTMIFLLYPFLYADKLMDVSDIAEEAGKAQGGWYEAAQEAAVVGGKWKAIPHGNIGQLMNWRTDWFAEVGVKTFPDTWDEFYEVGKKLKAKGHPYGLELGHGFGDNHGWIYPLLWSYGGHEIEADGKTVSIDSAETAAALDYARKLFKDCVLEDSLGWTDVSNNKAWMAEQISCTNNAESILWFAKRKFPDIAKVTDQAQNPTGPKGRFHLLNCISHSIFDFSPQKEEAHKFLRWLTAEKQQGGWLGSGDSYFQPFLHAYDNAPMWQVEPRNIPYRDAMKTAHLPGWPAPPNRHLAEQVAKYVIVDMFAKACTGTATKDAIKSAEAQLKDIYKTA